jgi:O-antigen/teichoic acid export membrane protein
MGIIIRQSVRTVAATYAGVAFGVLNTLLLYPLILSEEQIGLTRTLINAGLLFATFASLGAANIPTLFFPYFKDRSKRHNGFLFFVLMIGFIGSVFFLVLFHLFKSTIITTYSENAPLLVEYIYYLVPFTIIIVFWNILETYAIVNQLPVVPSVIREVVVRGFLSLGLILFFVHILSFDGYVRSIVITYGIALIATLFYLRFNDILFVGPDREIFSNPKIKEMMMYGGFVLMGNASGAIIANIDGLMLSAYSGLKSTGIYTIAFFIAQIVEIPKRSLSQVLVPLVSEANKNNDIPKLRELYTKSSINQLIIGGAIFLCLWSNIDHIFRFIPNGNIYSAGKWVVFFIGLSKLFDMLTGINAEIIGTSKYYKYDLLFYILLSIIGIGANIIFIPMYQMTGAAIASAISIFMFNVMRFIFIAVKFKIQPFSWSTLHIIVLGIAILFMNGIFQTTAHPLVNIIVRSVLIIGIFIGGAIALKASEDVNSLVLRISEKIKYYLGIS